MTTTGRRSAAPCGRVALAAGVLLAVALQVAGMGQAWGASGEAARPVVLVMVRDLTWSSAPSALDGFARASLSMRTAQASSDAADVYLTLGKGGRSTGLKGSAGVGRVDPATDGGLRLADWEALRSRDRDLHYGGQLGSVGEALAEGGRRWALVGDDPEAAAAAARADGTVPRAYPGTVEGLDAAVRMQPDAVFLAVPGPDLAQVLPRLDGMCALVVSASTPSDSRHLGVLAASPACGLGRAGLASPSTQHDHLATLPDVSRTFLALVGIAEPAAVSGGVVTPAAAVDRSTLVARDDRTWTSDRARTDFVWLFVVLHALGAVAAVRWRRSRPVVACALLGIPAASFLMMAVPWWRGGAWIGLLVGGTIAAVLGIAGALLARRDPVLGVGALAAVTAAVVGVDALFGSPLQIDAPFGNSPVVAGRFFGMGNIGSGLLVAGLLVVGGLAIDRWGRRAVPWVAAAMVAGAVAGGAPQFGADIGGVLFSVPAYGLLLLGARRGRITARHVVMLAAAALVAVAVFVAVDLARDSGTQTHLARSAGGGGLVDDVLRKGSRAVQTVKAPMANLVWIAVAALAFTRFSPGRRPALRFASWAVVVAAVLGSALNDSGVNVAAAVLAVAWPVGVVVASTGREEAPGPGPGPVADEAEVRV